MNTDKMVEDRVKSEKVISFSFLKTTTQAIQNGTGNFGVKRNHDIIMTMKDS